MIVTGYNRTEDSLAEDSLAEDDRKEGGICVGSLVQLKSGSPTMTVEKINKKWDNIACTWYDDHINDFRARVFNKGSVALCEDTSQPGILNEFPTPAYVSNPEVPF